MICQDLLNAIFSTDMKIGTISAPIDQSWWFFRLTWSFPLYQLVLWWLEVSTWPSRWLELAGKMFSHQTLYAAYTMRGGWGRGYKTSTFWQFFGIFRILTSIGTRKAFRSKEKSKSCKMGHPNDHMHPTFYSYHFSVQNGPWGSALSEYCTI